MLDEFPLNQVLKVSETRRRVQASTKLTARKREKSR
jgi:hypothetical protein